MSSNIVPYKDKSPVVDKGAYVNPCAVLIGDVTVHDGASLWPGVIVRANEAKIEIGPNTALLDRAFVEASAGNPVVIGKDAFVSHKVTLHGCTVHDRVLIGIGATVLDGAVIGEGTVIGARALVTSNSKIPPRSKVFGVPGKIIGPITDLDLEDIKKWHRKILERAKEYGRWFVVGQVRTL